MNFKILLLVIIAGVGVSSYGVLGNDMSLDIQKFDIIILPPMEGSMGGDTEFSGVQCSCRDPDNLDSGSFSPDFCDVTWIVDPAGPNGIKGDDDDVPGVPTSTSLGLSGNMLCTWEASSTVYGGLLDYDEGCSANYWLKSSDPTSIDYSWPMGYHPDYLYEDIFQIGFNVIDDDSKGKKTVSMLDEHKIGKFTEAYEMYVTNLEKLLENKRIDTKTAMSLKWLLNAIPVCGKMP